MRPVLSGGSFKLCVTVNDLPVEVVVEVRRSLVDIIRMDLGLTGTHVGCEHGVCGTCTILVNGAPARACLLLGPQVVGASLTTIEGLGLDGNLSPLQNAMHRAHSFQCGFCAPGILVSATALLAETPNPSEAEIREAISGNLCRCTGYTSIVAGIETAVELLGSSQETGSD